MAAIQGWPLSEVPLYLKLITQLLFFFVHFVDLPSSHYLKINQRSFKYLLVIISMAIAQSLKFVYEHV